MSFNFNRNFPDLEIPSPTAEKSHMIDILYKAYMGKTVCIVHSQGLVSL